MISPAFNSPSFSMAISFNNSIYETLKNDK